MQDVLWKSSYVKNTKRILNWQNIKWYHSKPWQQLDSTSHTSGVLTLYSSAYKLYISFMWNQWCEAECWAPGSSAAPSCPQCQLAGSLTVENSPRPAPPPAPSTPPTTWASPPPTRRRRSWRMCWRTQRQQTGYLLLYR